MSEPRPSGRVDSRRPEQNGSGPKPERPLPPCIRRLAVAYYRLYVASLPAFGGSIMELGSRPGTSDAPIPDAARARSRSFQRGIDRRVDGLTVRIECFIQNPERRPPPRWYCTPCGQLRSYEDRFCRLCGNSRPEDEPDGR